MPRCSANAAIRPAASALVASAMSGCRSQNSRSVSAARLTTRSGPKSSNAANNASSSRTSSLVSQRALGALSDAATRQARAVKPWYIAWPSMPPQPVMSTRFARVHMTQCPLARCCRYPSRSALLPLAPHLRLAARSGERPYPKTEALRGSSECPMSREHQPDRSDQDLDVEPQASRPHILDVPRDRLGKAEIAAPVGLRQPGDPWFDREFHHLLGGVVGLDLGKLRTWSDQTHVAGQHVPEIRQLVHRELAQDPSKPGDARIVADLELLVVEALRRQVVVVKLWKALR